MARNTVLLSQIVGDFILTQEEGAFSSNSSQIAIHNFALRGLREIGFDLGKKIRSLKLEVNSSNNTVELPDDFVDILKLGVVGSNGTVFVFPQNKNINYSQAYANSAGTAVTTVSSAVDSDGDGVYDRVDSKGATAASASDTDLDD